MNAFATIASETSDKDPDMAKIHIPAAMAFMLIAVPVLARSAPARNNDAVKAAHTVNDGGAREGANSFTEAQAREHITRSGYSQVSALKKDAEGVWRGTATKDGRSVKVGLDFKGNVVVAR
jgi:hypothetical protein